MEASFVCRTFSRIKLQAIHGFLIDNPDLLNKLPRAKQDCFIKICGLVSHLRSKKSRDFFIRTCRTMAGMERNGVFDQITDGALFIGSRNWAMVEPFFSAASSLPNDEDWLNRWMYYAIELTDLDIDIAITFLEQSRNAYNQFGPEDIFKWGERAERVLQGNRRVGKAAKGYLEESAKDSCGVSPERWDFYLNQANLISAKSPNAAEMFIRLGSQVCLLMNESETEQWVESGLSDCKTEDELCAFFSGTSLKSLEKRNDLASGTALTDRIIQLSLIGEAFCGRTVKIKPNRSLIGYKGFSGSSATDGRAIYLPETAPSFSVLKLMALHQICLMFPELQEMWLKKRAANIAKVHLAADKLLLSKLPGLFNDMKELSNGTLPKEYPDIPHNEAKTQSWWGDLLPGLVGETRTTIRRLKEEVAKKIDISPELMEAILSSVMSQGDRDFDELWSKIKEVLDNIDMTSPEAEQLEENVQTFLYREWDCNMSDYKMDWCLVRQRIPSNDPSTFVTDTKEKLEGVIGLLRRQFARLRPEQFKKYKAQPFGDELDVDALVQSLVELHAGSFLSDNIYIRRDKRVRDVAVLFLLDMSGSTEDLIHGQRIIDIQKRAMALMAEALDSLGDPFAIYGFTSEGRFRVDLFSVKGFEEQYNDNVRNKLGNLEPQNLTRMGAVVRHGIKKLEAIPAVIKLMVILTDGRPYDLEYGGLDYAVADTGKAFQEARKSRIHPFIITSDQKGASYLKRICPQTQSIILSKPELLPTFLPALYKRLTA